MYHENSIGHEKISTLYIRFPLFFNLNSRSKLSSKISHYFERKMFLYKKNLYANDYILDSVRNSDFRDEIWEILNNVNSLVQRLQWHLDITVNCLDDSLLVSRIQLFRLLSLVGTDRRERYCEKKREREGAKKGEKICLVRRESVHGCV